MNMLYLLFAVSGGPPAWWYVQHYNACYLFAQCFVGSNLLNILMPGMFLGERPSYVNKRSRGLDTLLDLLPCETRLGFWLMAV